jgi:hypothetical protein
MLTQYLRRFLFIFSLFFLMTIVNAQDDFDQTYSNEAKTFKVGFNDEWVIDEEDEDLVVFFNNELRGTPRQPYRRVLPSVRLASWSAESGSPGSPSAACWRSVPGL